MFLLQHESSSQDVVAVSEEVLQPPSDLPGPNLPIKKPKLKVNDIVFAQKFPAKPWKIARIIRISNEKGVGIFASPCSLIYFKY